MQQSTRCFLLQNLEQSREDEVITH